MPNRDHDDTPYNRSEGRFEAPHEERDDYRNERYRASRDWDRAEYRAGERSRSPYGSQYGSGYNPSRDDNDYRGGSRFEDRGSYAQSNYERDFQGARSWHDDGRWRDQEPQRGQFGSNRNEWSSRQPAYYGGQGNFGYGGQGNFGAPSSGGGLPNRDYTRDWDRDYARDWNRGDYARDWNRNARAFDARAFDGRAFDTRPFEGQRGGQREDDNDWGEQIRHAGHQVIGRVKRAFRGPKGYRRSDERIREDVNDRLAQQDEFDPSEIEVQVQNGEVTLSGSVRNRHEKFRAEEIADDVGGVNDVQNQLRVRTQAQQPVSTTSTSSTASVQTSRNGRA